MGDNGPDPSAAFEQELKNLRDKQSGWSVSLGNRDLNPAIRAAIETDWEKALVRQQEIEGTLADWQHREQRAEDILDSAQILDCLKRLPEVLALHNPTRGNLELSLHIDRIDCFQDGEVVMRTCKLGALTGAVEILAEAGTRQVTAAETNGKGPLRSTPRRRNRLRTDGGIEMKAAAYTAADPNRFAGLDDRWFWADVFHIPEKSWPFQEMAAAVAAERLAGRTHEDLAAHFGVTVPTIRKALRHAAESDERLQDLPRKMPRSRWIKDYAAKVAEMKASGMTTMEIAKHFGKSGTTIRTALEHAAALSRQQEAIATAG